MTVDRKGLSEALEQAKPFVGGSSAISVLSMIRIMRNRIIATDLRKSVIPNVPDFGFDVCVDYAKLSALLKKTRYEDIEVELRGKMLVVSSPEYEAEIATEPADRFPDVGDPGDLEFKAMSSDFRAAVSLCSKFASTDEARYFLNGVYVSGRDVVSTDGLRLAFYQLDSEFPPMPSMIIPSDGVSAYMGLDLDHYAYDDKTGKLWFKGPDGMFVVTLIDGQYLTYQKVLNCEGLQPTAEFDLSRDVLAGSEIVRIFQEGSGNESQKVTISVKDNVFSVNKQGDRGRILFRHEIEEAEVPDVDFVINYEFFVAAVQTEFMRFKVYAGKQINIESGAYTAVVGLIQKD